MELLAIYGLEVGIMPFVALQNLSSVVVHNGKYYRGVAGDVLRHVILTLNLQPLKCTPWSVGVGYCIYYVLYAGHFL